MLLQVLQVVIVSPHQFTIEKLIFFFSFILVWYTCKALHEKWIDVSLVASREDKDKNKGCSWWRLGKICICLSEWERRERRGDALRSRPSTGGRNAQMNSAVRGCEPWFRCCLTSVEDTAPSMEMWKLTTVLAPQHKFSNLSALHKINLAACQYVAL